MSEPTGLRERKKQRTYQAISQAAVALFLKAGFHEVSVAEVAAVAEVSKPTLFRYFPTKEDLVLYRFADHQEEAARVVRERPAELGPADALEQRFLLGLAERDPVTGLNDDAEVLAFHRLLYTTPTLVARLHSHLTRSEEALAEALPARSPDDPLAMTMARVTAAQAIATQRVLAMENYQRVAAGGSADAHYELAVSAARRGFATLRAALAASP